MILTSEISLDPCSLRLGVEPIVRLDDLLVLLRRSHQSPDSYFGCMINPRQESLAQTQEYLNKTSSRPLEPTRRDAWIAKLRELLGKQDIEVFGVDPVNVQHSNPVRTIRDIETTWRGIGDLIDRFTPQECANYLANAGYASA